MNERFVVLYGLAILVVAPQDNKAGNRITQGRAYQNIRNIVRRQREPREAYQPCCSVAGVGTPLVPLSIPRRQNSSDRECRNGRPGWKPPARHAARIQP